MDRGAGATLPSSNNEISPADSVDHHDDEENFFDLLSRFQSKRMDDQRSSLTVSDNNKENAQVRGNRNNNPINGALVKAPLNNNNTNLRTHGKELFNMHK